MPKKRTYSPYAKEAAALLGHHIMLGRKERRMSEMDFSRRVGIARGTLRKIEKGEMNCEIGIVLEAAALAGVPLFDMSSYRSLAAAATQATDKLTLLPKRIRKPKDVDDDF